MDNASTDGSADFIAETFPDVRLIRLDRNIGFGAAVNRAAAEATGTYLLLLNPDAEATPKSDRAAGGVSRRAHHVRRRWRTPALDDRRMAARVQRAPAADLRHRHRRPAAVQVRVAVQSADPEGRGRRDHRRLVAGRRAAGRRVPDGAAPHVRTGRRHGRALLPRLVRGRRPVPPHPRSRLDDLLRAPRQLPPPRRHVGRHAGRAADEAPVLPEPRTLHGQASWPGGPRRHALADRHRDGAARRRKRPGRQWRRHADLRRRDASGDRRMERAGTSGCHASAAPSPSARATQAAASALACLAEAADTGRRKSSSLGHFTRRGTPSAQQ